MQLLLGGRNNANSGSTSSNSGGNSNGKISGMNSSDGIDTGYFRDSR